MERFKKQLAEILSKTLGHEVSSSEIESPPDRTLGDFAYPCFKLSKNLKKAPPLIAQEVATQVTPLILPNQYQVKAAGPYVNFTLTPDYAYQTILGDLLAASEENPYGNLPKNSREKWVFEYSSPNVAKPFQIYHLRTTIVGSSLSKIARLRGFEVTTINHLGDWGTQYGKLAIALKKYKDQLPAELTLKDLVNIYVQFHKDIETDPSLEVESQKAFLKLEQGDPEMRSIWKKCVDISMKEFHKTYEQYKVEFDHFWGESFYETQLKPLLADLKKKGVLVEDQGAWIARVQTRDGKEIPPCILEKSDGATIYATRDVAAAIYRHEQFHFDRMSYVVGKEQKLHFEQVFGVLRAIGLDWEKNCEHIPTGLYRFKDAKMSTRKGNFITLEEVNELCMEKALKLMRERNTSEPENETAHTLSESEIQTIAQQVATGALVFADLSTDPTKDLEFDVDRVISFEGETGPYLQYAHTRCLSILKKAGVSTEQVKKTPVAVVAQYCKSEQEIHLLKTIGKFTLALERTLDQRKPSQLTTYLIDLTRDFGTFYRECKVMNPDQPELTQARLALVHASRSVLALGLDLLGIPKPEKM